MYLKFRPKTRLYPWFLRHFCQKANSHQKGKPFHSIELHVKFSSELPECTAEIPGLDLHEASAHIYLDGDIRDEGMVFESFDQCGGDVRRCSLARVSLLHALHKEGSGELDVFLVLKQIPAKTDKPECYRRIGMFILDSDGVEERRWETIIAPSLTAVEKEFWLF